MKNKEQSLLEMLFSLYSLSDLSSLLSILFSFLEKTLMLFNPHSMRQEYF